MDIASYLDSTNLSRKATRKDINKLIKEAIEYQFAGICITPGWVHYAKNKLQDSSVKLITVPNWEQGGGLSSCEGITDEVCELADEVDYIWNVYGFADIKTWDRTKKELDTIRKKVKGKLKVIIETYYLRTVDEKIYKVGINKVYKEACKLVQESGADFVKTDSGLFNRPDYTTLLEDCRLLLKYSKLPIKASGGVYKQEQAKELIELGVKRIGTSKAREIVIGE